MGIKAKLLILVALMVQTVSVVAQKTINQPNAQPTTEPPNPPITGNSCQALQGPPSLFYLRLCLMIHEWFLAPSPFPLHLYIPQCLLIATHHEQGAALGLLLHAWVISTHHSLGLPLHAWVISTHHSHLQNNITILSCQLLACLHGTPVHIQRHCEATTDDVLVYSTPQVPGAPYKWHISN